MEVERKRTLDELVALTQAGAVRAAAAFGQLAGETVTASAPLCACAEELGPEDAGATGVFFSFEGCLDALVGLLFPAVASERLVRQIVGLESGALDPTIVESALMEVGNILASHVASGIADELHARLLPSIPALAPQAAEAEFTAFSERVAGPDAVRIEVVLTTAGGRSMGRLIVVPTLGGDV